MTPSSEQPASQSATANGATGSTVQASRAAPTAARALRVVELRGERRGSRVEASPSIQRSLGYSHGNLHAIVATLVAMGYLRRDDAHRAPTPSAPRSSASAPRPAPRIPSVDAAEPHLARLADELGTEMPGRDARSARTVLVVARFGPELPPGAGVRGRRPGAAHPARRVDPHGLGLRRRSRGLPRHRRRAPSEPDEFDAHRTSLEAVRAPGLLGARARPAPSQALGEAVVRAGGTRGRRVEGDLAVPRPRPRAPGLPPARIPMPRSIGDGVQWSAPVFGPRGPGGAERRAWPSSAPDLDPARRLRTCSPPAERLLATPGRAPSPRALGEELPPVAG